MILCVTRTSGLKKLARRGCYCLEKVTASGPIRCFILKSTVVLVSACLSRGLSLSSLFPVRFALRRLLSCEWTVWPTNNYCAIKAL